MAPELGGSQISALLESVPGIARVLRSPVADAIVNMIRAGAGLEPFRRQDAEELIQFAVRRGLISAVEGDELMGEVQVGGRKRGADSARKKAKKPATAKKPKKAVRKTAPKGAKRGVKKAAKNTAKKTKKKATKKKATAAKAAAAKAAKKKSKKSTKSTKKARRR